MPAHDAHRHPRVRRQRSPGDEAAADRGALGRLRRLDGALDGRPPARGPGQVAPDARGVELLAQGADHGPYHLQAILPETDQDNLTFTRSLPIEQATDPASGILIAYEMNGEPLGRDHGAPFRLIVPHWYAVASVKWLKRLDVLTEPYTGEFQTGHYIYEWPDRPHEPVSSDARARPHHRPAARLDPRPGDVHRPGQGLVGHRSRHPRRGQPDRRGRLAARAARSRDQATTTGRTGASPGTRSASAATPCGRGRPTPPATCNPRCPRGTGSATATTPSRSSTSTGPEHAPRGTPRNHRRPAPRPKGRTPRPTRRDR